MMKIKAFYHKLMAHYHEKNLGIAFLDGNTRAFAVHMEHLLKHMHKYKAITGDDLDVHN